jgi:hypothetical protein
MSLLSLLCLLIICLHGHSQALELKRQWDT